MQWFKAWWRKAEYGEPEWAATRAKDADEAKAKIEAALGHAVGGMVGPVSGYSLQMMKANKAHYRMVP